MLHSPRLFGHNSVPKIEPIVLVKQLLVLDDNDDSMVLLIKKQDGEVLRRSLSLIANELLCIDANLDALFLLASKCFPRLEDGIIRKLLINSLNQNFAHQSIPCSDKYRGAELMLNQLQRLTKILASLSMMSNQLIHIGNNIHKQLVELKCQHTEDTLFTL